MADHMTIPAGRATGKTARIIWRALLEASENEDAKVAILVSRDHHADWTFTYLCEFARPIQHMQGSSAERTVTLPNGASIRVLSTQQNREGLRFSSVLEDR